MDNSTLVDSGLRVNFRHLYADVLWFGVLSGSAMAFLAIYASRLGASSYQVGLLTAVPAGVNLLFSLPAGRWMEGRGLIRISYLSAFWHRLAYGVLIFIPGFGSNNLQVWLIILLSLVMSIPGTVLAIAFNAMFADVVPPEWRGEVVGRRNALVAISVSVVTLVSGQLLDRIVYPLNYQIVFGIGALGAMMSTYHITKIHSLSRQPQKRLGRPLMDFARPGTPRFLDAIRNPVGLRFLTRESSRPLLRLDLLRDSFGLFLLSYLCFYTFQYFPIPLFPLFQVQELQLTNGEISLGSALFYIAMLILSLQLRWFSVRFGHRRVLVFSALVFCIYPLLNGLAKDASLYWVASALGGGVWALIGGGLVNRLMERVPEGDQPAHMALHNLVLNLGILAGSALGPVFANWIGLRHAILVSAGLRLLGGIFLGLWS